MSYITNAVKSSVITPLTAAFVVIVSGVAGYLVNRVTVSEGQPMMAAEKALDEAVEEEAAEMIYRGVDLVEPFFSLQNPVILVLMGCVLTLVILGLYSYVKRR